MLEENLSQNLARNIGLFAGGDDPHPHAIANQARNIIQRYVA